MALQSGDRDFDYHHQKPAEILGYSSISMISWNWKPKSRGYWTLVGHRLLAFFATAAATLVMALNKQTKTFVVATIGTTPLNLTLTAKFQHTPAFVFFVVANGLVSIHNLVMIMVELLGSKYKADLRLLITAILDMLNVALVSGGANAAAFISEVGKNGNKHARWDKICDRFDKFCDHGAGALIASFAALLLMILISVFSIFKLLSNSNK